MITQLPWFGLLWTSYRFQQAFMDPKREILCSITILVLQVKILGDALFLCTLITPNPRPAWLLIIWGLHTYRHLSDWESAFLRFLLQSSPRTVFPHEEWGSFWEHKTDMSVLCLNPPTHASFLRVKREPHRSARSPKYHGPAALRKVQPGNKAPTTLFMETAPTHDPMWPILNATTLLNAKLLM